MFEGTLMRKLVQEIKETRKSEVIPNIGMTSGNINGIIGNTDAMRNVRAILTIYSTF